MSNHSLTQKSPTSNTPQDALTQRFIAAFVAPPYNSGPEIDNPDLRIYLTEQIGQAAADVARLEADLKRARTMYAGFLTWQAQLDRLGGAE